MLKILLIILTLALNSLLSACAIGPNYKRPPVISSDKFKEAHKGWKVAKPKDDCDRGKWWKIYKDAKLNSLEEQLNTSNQTVATALANYCQAIALVAEARAALFPTLTANIGVNRQQQEPLAASSGSNTSGLGGNFGSSTPVNNESYIFTATWEPDLWGGIRRSVAASRDSAQASKAQLAATQLSAQASLAQFYFELRGLDKDQQLLDDTVVAYKKALQLTRNQYASGVAAEADIVQAQSLLESAQALAINNGVNRAVYEHAIAVLIGQPPANFSIQPKIVNILPPQTPLIVPAELLERRPDIAQAERTLAQANEQIGVTMAAIFPTPTLTASGDALARGSIAQWVSMPALGWTVAGQLLGTLFDGGLRSATVSAARANYNANLGTYRQTVLAAFQDVEDNLATLRILKAQSIPQNKAAESAKLALKLVVNQYKAGVVPYSSVITAEIAAFSAEKTAYDLTYLRMNASVGLVKALGGGWKTADISI